jgi:hypothetical protein
VISVTDPLARAPSSRMRRCSWNQTCDEGAL